MKYYINDIVEIITSKYKNYADVPQHEIGYFENQGKSVPFIGQRFRVYDMSNDYIYAKKGKDNLQLQTPIDNLMLYRRPIKNWIRSLFDIRISQYH